MKILVTGGAGFIGSKLARTLADAGHEVVVLDNFNDYYAVDLKRARVEAFLSGITIVTGDICDAEFLQALFAKEQFDLVCHLAAMAGVRYSCERPDVYVHNNIIGLTTLLDTMKETGCGRMVFASSSSVYGNSSTAPFTEDMAADQPESVYGATKRAGELLLHSYFKIFGKEATCLRFFTVYGPWSRPDMAMLKFAKLMTSGQPIDVYNEGKLRRDFTYVDDVVAGFVRAVEQPLGFEILNLGRGEPVELMRYIELLEQSLGVTAKKNLLPMQAGDVFETYADTTKAKELLDYQANVSIDEGIAEFAAWYTSAPAVS